MAFDGYEFDSSPAEDLPQTAVVPPDMTVSKENLSTLSSGSGQAEHDVITDGVEQLAELRRSLHAPTFEAPPIIQTAERPGYPSSPAVDTPKSPSDRQAASGDVPPTAPPPAPAPEQTPPADSGSHLWHVEGVKFRKRDNMPLNRPDEGSITNALADGEILEISVTREKPGQPFKVEASEPLLPPYPRATAPPEAPDGGATPQPSGERPANPSDEKFGFWTRLTGKLRPGAMDQAGQQARPNGPAGSPQNGGGQSDAELRLDKLAQNYSQGGYTVKIIAEPVSEEELERTLEDVRDNLATFERTKGRQREAAEMKAVEVTVEAAYSTAPQRTHVIIGATDRETLNSVARTLEGKVMPSTDTTWKAEGGPRQVTEYPTIDAALQAGREDPRSIAGAERFADLAVYPPNGMHGLRAEEMYEFAKHRPIPPGMKSTPFGKIIDHEDPTGNLRYAEDVRIPDGNDHTIIGGASRHGKTVASRIIIKEKLAEAYREAEAAMARGETPKPFTVITVDNEKVGNYAKPVSQMVQAAGVPAESGYATSLIVSPGHNAQGVWANLDILRPSGNDTPREHILNVKTAIASTVAHEEAQRVLGKFGAMAYGWCAEENGVNMATGQPIFPNLTPAPVDADHFRVGIEEVIKSSTFKKETQGDIGGYTKTQYEDMLRGLAAQLFTGGYPVDHGKVADMKGSLNVELGRITDPSAKRLAMTAIFQGQIAERRARHPDGDIHHTELLLVQDETAGLYDETTPAGAMNGHAYTMMGGLGVHGVTIQQVGWDKVHTDVTGNSANTLAFNTKLGSDREFFERRGIQGVDYLATAPPLRGIYTGSYMPEGPVNFAVEYPDQAELANFKPVIGDITTILDKGTDTKFYEGLVKTEASWRLLNTPQGARIMQLAELGAMNTLLGHEIAPMGDISKLPPEEQEKASLLKDELQRMTGREAEIRDCMIETAAYEVFASRKDIGRASNPDGRIVGTQILRDNMLAQARGEPIPVVPPEVGLSLTLDMGRYNRPRDTLIEGLTVGPLFKPEYEEAFDGASGALAVEQLDVLGVKERKSLGVVEGVVKVCSSNLQAIREAADRLTDENDRQRLIDDTVRSIKESNLVAGAARELGKILGGASPEPAVDPELLQEVGQTLGYRALLRPPAEGLDYVRRELESRLGRNLTANDKVVLDHIISNIPGDDPTEGVGYPAMRRELTKAIVDRYVSAPAVDFKQTGLEDAYGESFAHDADGNPLTTRRAQLQEINRRQAEWDKKSPYRDEYTHIKTNVLFARDRKRGGFIVDNNLQLLGEQLNEKRGGVYDARTADQNQGRMPDSTLVAQINRGDAKASLWAGLIADRALMSDDYDLPAAVSRDYVSAYGRHLHNLSEDAKKGRETQQQQFARLATMLGDTAMKGTESPGDTKHGQ